jgi:hypothetical protein
MDERTSGAQRRLDGVRIGAVIAVAVAIAFVVWLLVRGGDENEATTTGATTGVTTQQTTTASAGPATGPLAASPARLRALSIELGHPIYWAGPQNKTRYELTLTSQGLVYVRYLPRGVPVGSKALLTFVGSYPVQNAFDVLEQLAKKPKHKRLQVPGAGLGVYSTASPRNVYVAFPGSNLQIEVFDPSAERARRLVTSGQIAPVR